MSIVQLARPTVPMLCLRLFYAVSLLFVLAVSTLDVYITGKYPPTRVEEKNPVAQFFIRIADTSGSLSSDFPAFLSAKFAGTTLVLVFLAAMCSLCRPSRALPVLIAVVVFQAWLAWYLLTGLPDQSAIVSGTVTVDARPVSGWITFTPVDKRGGSAAGARIAKITNGTFSAKNVYVGGNRIFIQGTIEIDERYNTRSQLVVTVQHGFNAMDFPLITRPSLTHVEKSDDCGTEGSFAAHAPLGGAPRNASGTTRPRCRCRPSG